MPPNTPFQAEIIAVGTEVLMGEIINSNASYLSQALAELGVNVYYHTVVGDNPNRIKAVFETAMRRANLIVVTGGLGPTDDDLTVATLAELFETPMVADPASEERIRQFFIARGMPMSSTNLKQAMRPVDAEPLPNRTGTAPGLFWDVSTHVAKRGWNTGPCYILAFPGVPREMKTMWTEVAMAKLKPLLPESAVLVSRSLQFFGIGESMLGEKLRDLMAQASPTVSPYVGQAEVRIRIAAKAPSEAEALTLIEPVAGEIQSRLGTYCFGSNEEPMEAVVAQLLRAKQKTVSVAESCTGGLISSRLTDISGSSEYVLLNMVTYSNQAKETQLGVSSETLASFGAVSGQVAAEMAMGIREKAQTDIGLGITGIAGPTGGTDSKPVGLAYIGLAVADQCPIVKKVLVNAQYDRHQIKHWFSQYALNTLRLYLLDSLDPD
jgi:nicotinamide-nucleotide amidase